MKIFLAGDTCYKFALDEKIKVKAPFVLNIFYELRKKKNENDIRKFLLTCDDFILDSGAFTFMNTGVNVNLNEYVNEYIKFINKYDIKHFVEMDVDVLYSLDVAEKFRNYIEKETGKQSIPVWHNETRDLKYFDKMCDEYNYIAIAPRTFFNGKKKMLDKKVIRALVKRAHLKNTKVHGLGYTPLQEINHPFVHFDTIDSTTWNPTGRFGRIAVYKNGIVYNNYVGYDITTKLYTEYNYNTWVKIALDKK